MNVAPGKHPAREVLQAFGLGKLDDVSITQVSRHLETCVDCKRQVAELSGDSLLDKLRQGNGPAGTPAPGQTLAPLAPGKQSAPPPPNSVPPELLSNTQYEIVRELGAGGMGVVYLARNKLMDRLEVLKVISTAMVHKTGALDRFLREIRAAAALSHDNVVKAYTALQLGELFVFAMEYVEGDDLAKVVKTHGPLAVANACYYARQVALGLQHAHDKNMVHRDIKPHNLILARVGKKHMVKILDFGLAKASSERKLERDLTGEGKMLGTPDYMAPEQILDAAAADIRADIYSLGCTLYYLLSGSPPFDANSLFELLQAHQTKDSRPLNLVRPEVPVELAAVVAKMMAKNPSKRYQKPAEVAQALTPFFMKPGIKGAGGPASISVGESVKAQPRRPEVATKRSETVAPAPSETLAPAANPFAFAPEPLVQNPLPKKAKATARIRKRLKPLYLGLAVAVGLVFLGLVLWGIGSRVPRPDGTIVLENLPPGAEVKLNGVVVEKWLREVTALPVDKQADAVAAKLKDLNPGFDGKVDRKIENGAVVELIFPTYAVVDLSPVRALHGLQRLNLDTPGGNSKLTDLTPLQGLKLTWLAIYGCGQVRDLTPLKGMPLTELGLGGCVQVQDLTPLQGMKLTFLALHYAPVKDLTPLKDMPLTLLDFSACAQVHDLTPLKGMPLKMLTLHACPQVQDLTSLKGMPLTHLNLGRCGGASNHWLVHIKDLTNLEALFLGETDLSDAGLVHLKGMTKLSKLFLDNTKVGDEGLRALYGLSGLRELNLTNTKVTAVGIAALQKELPNCNIRSGAAAADNKGSAAVQASAMTKRFPAFIPADAKGLWRLEGEELVQDSLNPDVSIFFGDPKWKDYDFTVEAKMTSGNDFFFLWFRQANNYNPHQDAYIYALGASHNRWHLVESWENGKWARHAERGVMESPLEQGFWHVAKVSVRGNNGQCFLDRVRLFGFTADRHAGGSVGLNTSAAYRFKNIKVTAPDGTILLEGLPDLEPGILAIAKPEPPPILAKGLILIQEDGQLGEISPADHPQKPNVPYKVYSASLIAGTAYIIEMNRTHNKTNLDPYLILSDSKGETIAEDDNSGGNLNARIAFRPQKTEVYKIYAMTFLGGQVGQFRFSLSEVASNVPVGGGFKALFNGKDLSGWTTYPGQPENWRVENGILIGSGPAASHLFTKRNDFKDFHLRAEARINQVGDSGLFFRAIFGPETPDGYEAQIIFPNERGAGSLYIDRAMARRGWFPIRHGQWFALDVIAKGNHIVIKVNGKTTVNYVEQDRRSASGHIAVQQWTPQTVAEFRKIEIKEFP